MFAVSDICDGVVQATSGMSYSLVSRDIMAAMVEIQFMGSASTGQVLAEALGLALPGTALTPAPLTRLLRYARATGKQLVTLIEENLTPRRILTRDAFENAIILHAAVGGSTNALLHLPVIAREAGVDVGIDDFDRIHRRVPVLANVKTTGRYPVEYFWYAGGVPAVMLELRDMLHLDCLTVTGKTVGENLDEIEQSPFFFAERLGYLRNVKIEKKESSSRRRPLTPRWPSAAASGSRLGDGMTPASSRCTNGLPGTPRKARRSHRDRIGVAAGR